MRTAQMDGYGRAGSIPVMTESIDFNQHLGITRGEEPGTVILDTRPEHRIGPEAIHFAVLTTVAEVSAATVVGGAVVPASVHVSLLKAAAPGRLQGRGTLIRRGRRLAVAEGEVFQDGRLVAKATVQFAILGP